MLYDVVSFAVPLKHYMYPYFESKKRRKKKNKINDVLNWKTIKGTLYLPFVKRSSLISNDGPLTMSPTLGECMHMCRISVLGTIRILEQ